MSSTIARPDAAADDRVGACDQVVLEALAGTDHKKLALRVVVLASLWFLVGGLLALVIRVELTEPGMQLMDRDAYNQAFTMHGSTMIYLVIAPLALALGLYLVPLQVGAADLARPRVALLGVWLYALGGLIMWSGVLTRNGTGKATWIGLDPLSQTPWTMGAGQSLWMAGVLLAVGGMILLAACIFFTILRRRAPGMTMLRIPVFCWAMFITCLLVLVGFPALEVALGAQLAERHVPALDNVLEPIPYQHLFWFYGHPVVYVMFFPFLGAVAEVIATFAGRRFFGYRALVLSLLFFSGLSMAAWGHHMLQTGQIVTGLFALTSTLLIVPAGMDYFAMAATLYGGRIRLTVPMLFALGFALQFLFGGVTGIWLASPTLDSHVHDGYFVVAHFHYTLFAGSLFGAFAAVYYWWPKVFGWTLLEGVGKLHFWLLVVAANVTFFPMFLLGQEGMVRRIADYPRGLGWELYNRIETAGAFLIAIALLVFAWNVVSSYRRRTPAGDDPWEGQTLEWATSSPPPRHNFDRPLPPIRSYAPLLDLRLARAGAPSALGDDEPLAGDAEGGAFDVQRGVGLAGERTVAGGSGREEDGGAR
jgi:cytochrome c oxidase subunit 1